MIDYKKLFDNFRSRICTDENIKTPDITTKIKEFFRLEFSDHVVLPADSEKEFMVDIFVSTKNPRKLSEQSSGNQFRAILAVESELGGEGGGSQGYLKRNVIEDFAKLLVINSDYKVLIFTSLPYFGENDHINVRVREIESVYRNAGSPGDILLIHLESQPQKTINNNPTNPKVSIKRNSITGYLLSKDKDFSQLT